MRKIVKILGVNFDNLTEKEALNEVGNWLQNEGFLNKIFKKQYTIVTPNPEFLIEANKNPEFFKVLNKADLSIPDGIGILWASKFDKITDPQDSKLKKFSKWLISLGMGLFNRSYLKTELKERITGVDFMQRLCSLAESKGSKVFLLGAGEGVAELTAEKLQKKYPNLLIAGTFAGSPKEKDESEIIEILNVFKPEILFVAYGAPAQELWIDRNLKKVSSIKVAMGVGGAFDFISGTSKRAPEKMQKLGLEWLYRLYHQPSRIKRIFNAIVRFPIKVLKNK